MLDTVSPRLNLLWARRTLYRLQPLQEYLFTPFPAPYVGVSVTYNPGAIRAAELQNDITYAASVQDIKFRNNDMAARCRNLLIDQAQAYNDLKLQIIIFNNTEDDVRTILGTTDHILAGLRQFNSAAADLYYHDPSFNTQQTSEEQQANLALDAVVRNLYKLGKLLEMRWLEPFSNPIAVPGGKPIALDSQFDNFWSLRECFRARFSKREGPEWHRTTAMESREKFPKCAFILGGTTCPSSLF